MFIRGTSRSSSSYSLILLTGSWLYLSYSLLALLVNGAAVATNTGTVSDCAPNISEPHVPMYRLGGVPNLSRECEQALTPLLHDCHLQYFSQVRDAYVAAKCYEGGESFRRVACCRLWEAKECFVRAASARVECEEGNTTDHYRALPIDPAEREHLLDRCSEYQEGVAACEPDESLHASFSFGTFVTILLVFISLPAVAFGIMKAREFYLDYK
ncbi:hypothetical protein TYRP_006276 [Tyrophagus putrescentiae]|nr:hypothetical protein TYRP_006276 [Tyrophagus putrescentiae]